MSFHAPRNLDDALRHLAGGARMVAGGTDLFPGLGETPAPESLLDLSRLPELTGITRTETGWRIGAATTWSQIARADLPPVFDALRAAAREVGSVQIQNAGTLGGNLCNASPAADGVPPLLGLDAAVVLAGAAGQRRLPLGDFILGPRRTVLRPGELLVAVTIPDHPDTARSAFVKLGNRRYMVISVAMVAVTVRPDGLGRLAGVRIAVGACSAVARRLPAVEALLTGQPWDRLITIDLSDPALAAPLAPIDDTRGSAAYRREVVPELVRRALAQVAAHG